MLKKILVLLFLVPLNLFAQQGWVQQTSGTSNNLCCVQFLNATTGFAGGYGGVLLKTTNGGASWTSTTSSLGTFYQVQFLDANTGFAYTASGIAKTTNGGINWLTISSANDGGYFHFADINTGFCISSCTAICEKTTNSGANWQTLGSSSGGIPGSKDFVYLNDNNIYAAGWDFYLSSSTSQARISKSTNGGLNWSFVYYAPMGLYNNYVAALVFPNERIGYGVGLEWSGTYSQYFYRTTNSGLNWVKQHISNQMNSLAFTDTAKGWLVGLGGAILYTTNSGANFSFQDPTINVDLQKIFMVNDLTGWIVGNSGIILKTTNGGLTPVETISSNVPSAFSLSQNYPNPFNPGTKIKFQIAKTIAVKLTVYDELGRDIETLVNEQLHPGTYEVYWNGTNVASGIYFYRLQSDNFVDIKKMVLLK